MTERLKVAICDDESSNREFWKNELDKLDGFREHFEIELVVAEATNDGPFRQAIDSLGERRRAARNQPSEYGNESLFDQFDVLVVDYDLINAVHGDWITGEEIAYLARCYSRCKTIVAVNQFGSNPFDLNLTGHFPDSFADVNVGDKQVANPGLWSSEWPGYSFRPWCWPILEKLVRDFDKRVNDLLDGNLDRAIKDVLSFDDEAWLLLPREMIAYITPRESKKPPKEFTAREIVENSPLGMRHKDEPLNDEAVARIAAARLSHWLDYAVLAAQNILVDAPHLVERYPSLTGEAMPSLDRLNDFARIADPTELGLDERLASMAFSKPHWLSRPAWYWPLVARAEWIEEVKNPWSSESPDAFFCEDVSHFEKMTHTRNFPIRVPSVYDTRRCIDFRAEGAEQWATALSGIDYQPSSWLMI